MQFSMAISGFVAGWGGLILLGEARSCLGFWRGEFDWCPFAPKNSDSPEVLVFVRVPGTAIDIETAREARDGGCKRKRSYGKRVEIVGKKGNRGTESQNSRREDETSIRCKAIDVDNQGSRELHPSGLCSW